MVRLEGFAGKGGGRDDRSSFLYFTSFNQEFSQKSIWTGRTLGPKDHEIEAVYAAAFTVRLYLRV